MAITVLGFQFNWRIVECFAYGLGMVGQLVCPNGSNMTIPQSTGFAVSSSNIGILK